MNAVDVILFRHSPRPIELWHLNGRSVIILSHEHSRPRYRSDPAVDESMVRFLPDFEIPTLFRAVRTIAKEHAIRSISTLAEEDVATAGLLEEFFVSGLSEYAVNTLFKDKLFMRSALEGIVPQPSFRGLEEFTGTREQLISEGFSVLKPRRSAGAQGVYLLNEMDDTTFAEISLAECIAESFVESSRMLTSDGFSVGYDIRHFYVHEYDVMVLSSLGKCDGVAVKTSSAYDESPDLLKVLFDFSQLVLRAIGSGSHVNPFHFEWFIPEDGTPVFCEVGRRFGGMGIPRLVRFAFDAPMLEDYWATMVGGGQLGAPLTRDTLAAPQRRAICYARYRVKGKVVSAPTSEDFAMAENAWIWVRPGDEIPADAEVVTDDFGILEFIGSDAIDVEEKLTKARSIFDKRLVIK